MSLFNFKIDKSVIRIYQISIRIGPFEIHQKHNETLLPTYMNMSSMNFELNET